MNESRRLFEQVFRNSLDGVLVTRGDGTVLRANPAACRLLRRTEEEICRAGRAGLVVQDENLQVALARRESASAATAELTWRLPDGSTFLSQVSSGFVASDEGEPYALVIFRDISGQSSGDRVLQRTVRALQLLKVCNEAIARAPDETTLFNAVCNAMIAVGGYKMCWAGLAEHDEHRRVRPVAFAGEENGYLSLVEIVWGDGPLGRGPTGTAIRTGTPVFGRYFSADSNLNPWRAEALKRGYVTSSALPLVHDGERIGSITMYSAEFEPFDDAEVELLRDLSRDISFGIYSLRQRQARQIAESGREQLAHAIGQAAETVVITDLRGDIQYVNPAFEHVTGYRREEVLGKNPRLLKSGEQGPEFYRELWATITGGRTWTGRLVNRKKDGTLYTEEASISPVRDGRGQITSYVAVKRDISRNLALEAQLLQAQKMEAVGQLAAGVAHDFNNLLSVILSYSNLILKGRQAGDPEREDLEEIRRAGERAVALTRQLLAFSRRQILQPRVLDLGTIIVDMEKMIRRLVGEQIQIHLNLRQPVRRVHADPHQLEQVLLNLVVNARDAMPRGGTLRIEVSEVESIPPGLEPEPRQGPFIQLSVTDTGVGIDPAIRGRIFEPFFTTKAKGTGTGLGLSTVFGIVKQSRGYISVESEPGRGTTFRIYLPAIEQETDHVAENTAHVASLRGEETILLVEDDEQVRSLETSILRRYGYHVLDASNGGEALLITEQHEGPIHLLVADVVMPRMSGQQLATRLSARLPSLKVLYVSGYSDGVLGNHGALDPGINLLMKPIVPDMLVQRVREVLDRPALA